MFSIGKAAYQVDNTQNITEISDNISIIFDKVREEVNITYDGEQRAVGKIFNLIDHTVDYLMNIFKEVTTFGIEYGYNNPDHNFNFYMKFIVIVLFINIFAALFMPILIIIMLIVMFVKWIKEKKIYQKAKQKIRNIRVKRSKSCR